MNKIKTKLLFFAIVALIFLSNLVILTTSLEEVLIWVRQAYAIGKDQQLVLRTYLNEYSWLKFRVFVFGFSFVLLGVFFFYRQLILSIGMSVSYVVQMAYKKIRALSPLDKAIIVFMTCSFYGLLFFYSSKIYIQLDELNCWLYFVERGPFVTMSYFPSSNNHVGYNLISIFWNQFLSPVMAMRTTAMLSAVASVVILYMILLKRYTRLLACVGSLLLMSLSTFFWYGIQGRAYALELLILLVLFYLVWVSSDRRLDWFYIICSALALYAISVALIPVVLLLFIYVYHIPKNSAQWERRFTVCLGIVFCSLLLYAPIWIFSDARLLYTNPLAMQVSWIEAPWMLVSNYYPHIWSIITGLEGYIALYLGLFLGLLSVGMLLKRTYTFLLPLFFVLVVPSILFLVYPVVIFERTWLWLCIPLIFWMLECFRFIQLFSRVFFYSSLALVLGLMFYFNIQQLDGFYQRSTVMEQQLEELKHVVCDRSIELSIDDDILYTYFRYYERSCNFSVIHRKVGNDQGWVLTSPAFDRGRSGSWACRNSMGILYKSQ